MRKIGSILSLLVIWTILSGCGGSVIPVAPGIIIGTVRDDGTNEPISGATVTISGKSDTTGVDGTYEIRGVSTGSATMTAVASGYQNHSQQVTVASGQQTIDIRMQRAAAEISGSAFFVEDSGYRLFKAHSLVDEKYGRSPFASAQVSVYNFRTGDLVAGPITTDSQGGFRVTVPLGIDALFVCTKGDYRLSLVTPHIDADDDVLIDIVSSLVAEAYAKGTYADAGADPGQLMLLEGQVKEALMNADPYSLDFSVGGGVFREHFGDGLDTNGPDDSLGDAIQHYIDDISSGNVRIVRDLMGDLRSAAFSIADTGYAEMQNLGRVIEEEIGPNLANLGSEMPFMAVALVLYFNDPGTFGSGHWLVDIREDGVYASPDPAYLLKTTETFHDFAVFKGEPGSKWEHTTVSLDVSSTVSLDAAGSMNTDTANLSLGVVLDNARSGAHYEGDVTLDAGMTTVSTTDEWGNAYIYSLDASIDFHFSGSVFDPGMPSPLVIDSDMSVGLSGSAEDESIDFTLESIGSIDGPGFSYDGSLDISFGKEDLSGAFDTFKVKIESTGSYTIDGWATIEEGNGNEPQTMEFLVVVNHIGGYMILPMRFAANASYQSSDSVVDFTGQFSVRFGDGGSVVYHYVESILPNVRFGDYPGFLSHAGYTIGFEGEINNRDGSTVGAKLDLHAQECGVDVTVNYHHNGKEITGTVNSVVDLHNPPNATTEIHIVSSTGVDLTVTHSRTASGDSLTGEVVDGDGNRLATVSLDDGLPVIHYTDGGVETVL